MMKRVDSSSTLPFFQVILNKNQHSPVQNTSFASGLENFGLLKFTATALYMSVLH